MAAAAATTAAALQEIHEGQEDTQTRKQDAAQDESVIGGISARFLSLGAIIQSFSVVDDATGGTLNIVQNFATTDDYRAFNVPYFGETIGRVANRIAGARIASLNGGKSYQLDANDGSSCLHGGLSGWGKQQWALTESHDTFEKETEDHVVRHRFVRSSEDGDGGFPGKVDTSVTYTDRIEKSSDGVSVSVLDIEYQAELVGGAEETVVAMTNHSYFNLKGANSESTIAETQVILSTNKYLPVDESKIPLGNVEEFPGIKPKQSFSLGTKEPDVDHCFLLNTDPSSIPLDTRSQPLRQLASFYYPSSRVHLEVHSTEPAFQFYNGKYIDVPAVGNVPARGPRTGFCVEPCRYINAVNVDEWKAMVVLKKGHKYGSRIVYRAWKDSDE